MINKAIIGLSCQSCNQVFPAGGLIYTCPNCGRNLDYTYDYSVIGGSWSTSDLLRDQDRSIWRYLPLLPVQEAPVNRSIQVGGTPLLNFPEYAGEKNLLNFYIKDDSRNPSGSLKDRASEVAIQHARELGKTILVAASTGNAGSSLAALAAFHGMEAVIFAPAAAPEAKLTQIQQHGARLVPVDGNYDTAFDLAFEWSQQEGQYSRNTGINPILAEGKKTVALEIAEQLGWNLPEHLFIPVGDGCIISGVYKGFYDLKALGWIDNIPKLHGVQAAGSAAIVRSLSTDNEIIPVHANTIADSISVDHPRDGDKARRAILQSKGSGIEVTDDEILKAQHQLSTDFGIFAEPAAAAAFAGFLKGLSNRTIKPGDRVLVLITGSGLKDIKAARTLLPSPSVCPADLDAVTRFLREEKN